MMCSRLCQGALNGPSGIETLANLQSQSPFPFCDGQRVAVEGDFARRARVNALFSLCGPSAVVRRVVAIVVDAVKTVQIAAATVIGGVAWLGSNVGIERGERSHPPIADHNSTPAVVFPCRIIRISAFLFNAEPDRVFGRISESMRTLQRSGSLASQTAAAPRAFRRQHNRRNRGKSPAVTATTPVNRQVTSDAFKHYKAAEPLAA